MRKVFSRIVYISIVFLKHSNIYSKNFRLYNSVLNGQCATKYLTVLFSSHTLSSMQLNTSMWSAPGHDGPNFLKVYKLVIRLKYPVWVNC